MIRPLAPLLLLGACAAPQQPPVVGGSEKTCDTTGLDDLVGKPATGDLAAEALKRSGARTMRWLQPGTMVTMEFRRDRLNLHLDAQNTVTRANCG